MLRTSNSHRRGSASGLIRGLPLLGLLALSSAPALGAETSSADSIETVLERANLLYSENKYEDARLEYERAIDMDRGSLAAWRGLAWSLWGLNQKERAYQIWEDLLKAFPNNQSIILALGKASEQDHRWAEALEYYSRALENHPGDEAGLKGRARILLAQGDYQPAEEAIKKLLAENSNDPVAESMLADALMQQGDYRQAEAVLRPLAKTNPVPINLRRLGRSLAELGKYDEASNYFRMSLRAERDEPTLNAWRRMGSNLYHAGQNEPAMRIWQEILQDFPGDYQTLLALGKASERGQLLAQGLEYYTLALKAAPGDTAAHLGRARIYSAQKDYEAAEREVQAVLNHSPENAEARFELARTLVGMGRNEQAEAVLRPLTEHEPDSKNLRQLGIVLAELGKNEEAINYLKKSLQSESGDYVATLALAHAYWNLHRYREGQEILKTYLNTNPDRETVRARLAEQYAATGDWDQAAQELKYIVDKHPEDNAWKMKLARLLHRAGRHEEGVQIATEILDTDPNYADAISLIADDAILSGHLEEGIRWTMRLNAVAPTPDRLIKLGQMRIEEGANLKIEGKKEAASIQFAAAYEAYRQASELDPIKSKGPVEMVDALRLGERYQEAIALAESLREKYPNSVNVIQQLTDAYEDQGNYPKAREHLESIKPYFPDSPVVKQRLAKLAYYSGDKAQAFDSLNEILKEQSGPSIPVLLYHGITDSDHQDTVPTQRLREQLLALKQAGYKTITMRQLYDYFEGNGALPKNPIIISFDDARSDSFYNADPILKETGFTATMFVPVGDIGTNSAYTVVWSEVRSFFDTGRWDVQCHSTEGQHVIPVNSEGHLGRFLVNRKWLGDQGRLETFDEYAERVENDYTNCKEVLSREVPGSNIVAFAFPFGDQGHRSLSNEPGAFDLNHEMVSKHFGLGFHVINNTLTTKNSPRYSLPRFEVPRTFTGKELVGKLKSIDPHISTENVLVALYIENGQYSEAMEIFSKLEEEGAVDSPEQLTKIGKILKWNGDYGAARERFEQAMSLSPEDPMIQQQITELDRRFRPLIDIKGFYFEDNARRSYYGVGPSVAFNISDRLAFWGYYKHLNFDQRLAVSPFNNSDNLPLGENHFHAVGNQFEGQLSYTLGNRSSVSVSAGAADFSGHSSREASKTPPTFPIGSAKLNVGVGDNVDLILSAEHEYVNTAGAILNDLSFTRVFGGFTVRPLENLRLSASNGYFNYTDNNQRNRTEVTADYRLLNVPDSYMLNIGARFIYDDTQNRSNLFWTPNNYIGLTAPVTAKVNLADSWTGEVAVAPGIGKEAGQSFQFQINAGGVIRWNLNDDMSLYVSGNRYEAATYSNFSAFAGFSLRY